MNKGELVTEVAKKTGLTQKEAQSAVNGVLDVIIDTLKAGEVVNITGFGSFVVRERAAREGKNPRTGEKVQIAACKVPGFKAGKALKDAVKG